MTTADLLASEPSPVEVILVGDLFYEQPLAARLLSWLKLASRRGSEILIGDPFRTYLPLGELDLLTTYHVPVSRDLEDREIRRTSVFRLRTQEIAWREFIAGCFADDKK